MRNRIPQIATIFAIAIIMSMAIPSSFAKYTGTNTYTLTLKKNVGFFWNSWDNSAQVVTLPLKGRYAIIAKGGDGANGYSSSGTTYSEYNIEGGIGGTVMGVYTTTSTNQKLYIAPGSVGTRPPKSSASSSNDLSGGSNATTYFGGGKGDYVSSSGFASWIGSKLSYSTQSGGGGAATIVCTGDSYSKSNIILIAGGGGAAGCWNSGWSSFLSTKASGTGGNGGSNVGTYASSSSGTVTSTITGNVFSGSDGTGASYDKSSGWFSTTHYDTYGKAGTTSGGAKGTVDASDQWSIKGTANADGATFANNGAGGYADNYGGGGGGGYCGGGGGTGTSIAYAAGGGGGGSSFVASSLSTDTSKYSDMITKATANTDTGTDSYGNTRNGAIPTQYDKGYGYADDEGEGGGFVIIMYLGS